MLYHLGFHFFFLLSPHKPYSLLLFSPADTQHLPLSIYFFSGNENRPTPHHHRAWYYTSTTITRTFPFPTF